MRKILLTLQKVAYVIGIIMIMSAPDQTDVFGQSMLAVFMQVILGLSLIAIGYCIKMVCGKEK